MRRMLLCLVLVVAALSGSTAAAGATSSVTCTTDISGPLSMNVVVPSGATCVLTGGATISGNVSVGSNARLFVVDGATVNGNVEAGSGSFVLMSLTYGKIQGNYTAQDAHTAMLNAPVSGNVSFSGGSYGLVGVAADGSLINTVAGHLDCGGGVTGASTTGGSQTSGCTVGSLEAGLDAVVAVLATSSNSGGSSGGSGGMSCSDALAISGALDTVKGTIDDFGGGPGWSSQASAIDGFETGILTACGTLQ